MQELMVGQCSKDCHVLYAIVNTGQTIRVIKFHQLEQVAKLVNISTCAVTVEPTLKVGVQNCPWTKYVRSLKGTAATCIST